MPNARATLAPTGLIRYRANVEDRKDAGLKPAETVDLKWEQQKQTR
jgi:hypothetical protein